MKLPQQLQMKVGTRKGEAEREEDEGEFLNGVDAFCENNVSDFNARVANGEDSFKVASDLAESLVDSLTDSDESEDDGHETPR